MPHSRGWRDKGRLRGGDPASVGEVLQGLMAERVLAQGIMVGRLAGEWAEVVGERLAEETAPARLEAGTLTVSASSGAWGAQVQFLSEDLRRGANRALGSDVVKRVRVVVQQEGDQRSKPL
jgi:predicted nucleic acid-binding Zn ribbon protein